MAKRFLKYQFALAGTNENDITAAMKREVEQHIFPKDEYGVGGFGLSDDNEIAFYGEIVAQTKQECKAIYLLLKSEAKRVVPHSKKAVDLIVGMGDKLW